MTDKKQSGYRAYDKDSARARIFAEKFTGGDLRPGEILSTFKKAAPGLKLSRRHVDFIDQLFAYTQEQDWSAGQKPIVWPSNQLLAEHLNISVRQIQNLTRQCYQAGLIDMHDSPTGKRYGQRNHNGTIRVAYGFNLAPLGARLDEFKKINRAFKEDQRRRRDYKRKLSVNKRIILRLMDHGHQKENDSQWSYIQTRLDCLFKDHDPNNLETLSTLNTHILNLRLECEAIFDELYVYSEASDNQEQPSRNEHLEDQKINITPEDERDFIHITTTTELPFSPKTSNGSPEKGVIFFHDHSTNPSNQKDEAIQFSHRSSIHIANGDLDDYKITPEMALKICPQSARVYEDREPDWRIVEASAEGLIYQRNLRHDLWADLHKFAGPRAAAIAVFIACRKADCGLVTNLGGYLRGMAKNAQSSELRLGRSVYGVLPQIE